MSLSPGTRLGPYEITTAIGAGGKGEVYRAKDTRLDRDIWVQPIDGGAPRPLTKFTEKDVTAFTWSPDGKRLAIIRSTAQADIVLIKGIR